MPADISVLIVDSDAAARARLQSRMNRLGYQTTTAESVEIALALVATDRYMLVLMPFSPEDRHGADMLRVLRAVAPSAGVIVIGRRSLNSVLAALRAGVDDYLPRPVRNRDLVAAIGRVGQAREGRAHKLMSETADTALAHEASMAALSRLAASLAHEINNPLTPILGMAELLIEDLPAGHIGHDYAQTIIASTQRIRAIIRSLLDFARPSAQQPAELDLRALLQSTLVLVNQQLRDSQIALDIQLPESPVIVAGSAAQLKELLLLLIENAREAMPEGGALSIQVAIIPDRSPPQAIVLMRDTGVGISPGRLPYIFEPFYSTKPQTIGVGLGLAVASGIVRAHSGMITVDSVEGQGSAFRVTLPLSSSYTSST
jgi:signal transduction histidine kinase